MIFDSATVSGSLVAMVELKDPDGATLVVPLRLNKRQEGYEVNEISSVYGRKLYGTQKPNNQWFINQVEEGRLRYIDTKKSSAWLDAAGLCLPGEGASRGLESYQLSNKIVKTKADLVKLKQQFPCRWANVSFHLLLLLVCVFDFPKNYY